MFDVYRGPQVGEGRKSLALHLVFQAADRTLTDAEADAVRARVVAALADAGRRGAARVRRDRLVGRLDGYFGTLDVRGDDWASEFELVYPEPYWREYAEPGYEGRWNGLLVRGGDEVERVATCVFPSDRIVGAARHRAPSCSRSTRSTTATRPASCRSPGQSFERMRADGISFYHVHAPIDQHPEVSPSRLCAAAMGVPVEEEYLPIAEGIPGGAAVIGASDATLDALAARLQAYLGPEVPVQVVRRRPGTDWAGRVTVVGGGGTDRRRPARVARARLPDLRHGRRVHAAGRRSSWRSPARPASR